MNLKKWYSLFSRIPSEFLKIKDPVSLLRIQIKFLKARVCKLAPGFIRDLNVNGENMSTTTVVSMTTIKGPFYQANNTNKQQWTMT